MKWLLQRAGAWRRKQKLQRKKRQRRGQLWELSRGRPKKEGQMQQQLHHSLQAAWIVFEFRTSWTWTRRSRRWRRMRSCQYRCKPIGLDRLCFGVITGQLRQCSEWSNRKELLVSFVNKELCEKGYGKANLMHWKSSKIHRVVNSTLAAEAESLSKGLSELAWSVTVFNEMVNPRFELKEWQQEVRNRRLHALTKQEADETLKKGLCVVDAKSLFDHLVKETIGSTDDRRNGHRDAGDQAKHGWDGNRSEVGSTWSNDHRLPDQNGLAIKSRSMSFLDTGLLDFRSERST